MKRLRLLALGLALLVGGGVLAARSQGMFERLELASRDARFRARFAWRGAVPADAGVALLAIDAKTLDRIELPFTLWRPQVVQVIHNLRAAGARVIAPDLLYELAPEALQAAGPDYAALGQRLAAAEQELAGEILDGPVLVAAHLDGARLNRPRPTLYAVAGDRVALVNLLPDLDGVVRSAPHDAPVEEGGETRSMPFLAVRAAELALSRPLPSSTLAIDYSAPPGQAFPTVSFWDALQAPPSAVRDRVVVLGGYDRRLGDFHLTPFGSMAGIEIHAHAINTLLSGQRLTAVPASLAGAGIMLLALLAGALAWRERPLAVLGGTLLLLALWSLLAFSIFAWRGLWLELTAAWLALPAACLAVYALRAATVEKDRAQLVSTFGHMVSAQVLRQILFNPEKLDEHPQREVTVLFSDINNFTPTCEAHTPAQILDMLSDYFTSMVSIIHRHDGYIKQYVGDEIMVIFGAPHDQADHAHQAVLAALDMQEALVAKGATAGGRPGFYDVKVGINTGVVVVGKVGSEERWEYAAVGDDVNLGSRIMGLTKKLDFQLLVSQSTYDRCRDLEGLEWIPFGEQEFKGKTRKVQVWGVRRAK